ncbi:MAG TPA: hypothetical protein VIJ25_17450 [Methylococcales bacterium]
MEFDIDTEVPAILMDVAGERVLERCGVENQTASDLSGFNDRPLRQNHVCKAERQFSSLSTVAGLALDGTDMNS